MKRILFFPFMAALASLSGCAVDILNAAYLGAIVSSTTLYPAGEHKVPAELGQAMTLDFHREFWRADGKGKCTFNGVLLPYDRTWPEEVEHGDGNKITLPPEPGKIAAYVSIINSKSCPPSEPQTLLLAGIQRTKPAGFLSSDGGRMVDLGMFSPFTDMSTLAPEDIPQWFPQAIERLTKLAPTTPSIKAFLERSSENLERLLPDQAAVIQMAIQ